ncbi:MAG: tetratricopeptide repeat protein [Candidatus Thorarchaeota archaeon]
MRERGIWSKKIYEKIRSLKSLGTTIGIDLPVGTVVDATSDSIQELRDFAPDVNVIGFQQRFERRYFGGVLYRAVRNTDDTERCLQYIYVYTRQFGAINILWMVIIPLIMGLWAYLASTIFQSESSLMLQAISDGNFSLLLPPHVESIPWLITGAVWIPMLLGGIAPHLGDILNMPKGQKFYVRSTTLLIPYGILMWLVPFFNFVYILLVLIAAICFLVAILEWRRIMKSAHDMDYAPVFVWIRRAEGSTKWQFDKACWDYYHYFGVMKTVKELKGRWGRYISQYLRHGKKIRLLMDNSWHSFFLGSKIRSLFLVSVFLFPALILVGILFAFSDAFGDLYPVSVWWLVILSFLSVLSGWTIARLPFRLVKSWDDYIPQEGEDPEKSRVFKQHHLSSEKLRWLWNLREKQARFVIISKMQNPFHLRSDFFLTFRDETEYLLYDYGFAERLCVLESEAANARYLYGLSLMDQKEYESSEVSLKRAVELKPDFSEAYRALSDLYLETDQPEKAEALYNEMRTKFPYLAQSWIWYGVTLEKMGRKEDAQHIYTQAIETEREKMDAAQSIRQIMKSNPDISEGWEALGDILDSEGQSDEAREAREKAKKKTKK